MQLSNLVGKHVFVRTVTNYYTGRLNEPEPGSGFLSLGDAAWIADTGRFADALAKGTLNEIEPYPEGVLVAIGSIVDICEWGHDLPRKQR